MRALAFRMQKLTSPSHYSGSAIRYPQTITGKFVEILCKAHIAQF